MEKAKELLGMKSKDDEKLEQDYRREGISRPSDRPGERPIVTERVEQTKYEAVGTRSDEPTGYTRQPPLGMTGQSGEPQSFADVEQRRKPEGTFSGYTNEPVYQGTSTSTSGTQSGTTGTTSDKVQFTEDIGRFPEEQRDRPLAGDFTQYNRPNASENVQQQPQQSSRTTTQQQSNEYVKAGVQPASQNLSGSVKPLGSDREWR